MPEALVVFPKGGNLGSPENARINPDLIRGAQGRRVTWDFLSCNPQIKTALVIFEDAEALFFTPMGGSARRTWYAKNLVDHKEAITGTVPKYGKEEGSPPIAAKYWVMGFDMEASAVEDLIKNGAEPQDLKQKHALSALDPIVVTGDPS